MSYSTLFFDLDNTLYPADSGIWEAISGRINLYITDRLGIETDDISSMRNDFFYTYGTTMRGLQTIYKIDPLDYLEFVHDIPVNDYIKPDFAVRNVLEQYPQRRIIFTNADQNHAGRVLKALNLEDLFPEIIDVMDIAPYCKPQMEAFRAALCKSGGLNANECIMIDDQLSNLSIAHSLGFYTIWVGGNEVKNGCDASITTLVELPKVLNSVLTATN